MPNYPNYTIRQAAFNPTIFQGIDFNPQQADMSLLANSFARMEERERTAGDKLSGLQATFAKLRESVINTPEMNEWLDKYSRNIVNEVQSFARHSDYAGAITAATNLAGQVLNDPALQGRIKFSAQVNEEDAILKQRLAKGEINQNTYDWAKHRRNLQYEDELDNSGNIVGGTNYAPMIVHNSIDWNKLNMDAFNGITAAKDSRTDTTQRSYNNPSSTPFTEDGHTQEAMSAYGYKIGSGTAYQKVTVEEIRGQLKEMIALNPELRQSVWQEYQIETYMYRNNVKERNDLANQIELLEYKKQSGDWTEEDDKQLEKLSKKFDEAESKIMYENQMLFTGGETAFENWFVRKVTNGLFAENLAYNWTTSSYDNSKEYSRYAGSTKKGASAGTNEESEELVHPSAGGVRTEQTHNYDKADIEARAAGKSISDIAKKNNKK